MIVHRTQRDLGRNVQLLHPFLNFGERAWVRSNRQNRADPVQGQKLHRALIFAPPQRIGFEHLFQFLGQRARPAVLHFKCLDPLPGERIAVKQVHQFQGSPHIPAVVQHDQQIAWIVADQLRTITAERLQNFQHLARSHVTQEHQIQHHPLVFRNLRRVGFGDWRDRLPRHVGRRHDPEDIARLHHGQIVHPQNRFQQRAQVHRVHHAESVNGDRTAFYRGIQHVVDLQLPRQDVDHIQQRSIGQIQTSHRSRGRRGLWRLRPNAPQSQSECENKPRHKATRHCFSAGLKAAIALRSSSVSSAFFLSHFMGPNGP